MESNERMRAAGTEAILREGTGNVEGTGAGKGGSRTPAHCGATQPAPDEDSAKPFWRSRTYGSWFTADTASAIGLALQGLAISLIGYKVSGSTAAAGWLGTASAAAKQTASLFGGTFADRHDRRLLIIANGAFGMFAWGSVAALLAADRLGYWALLAIATAASGVAGFLTPASDALLRSIIPIRDYPQARSVNEGRDAAINMGGSPLGGLLYAVRPWLPFLVASVAYALAGAAASGISYRAPKRSGSVRQPSFAADFAEGWRWTVRHRMVVVIVAGAAVLNFGTNGIANAVTLNLVATGTNSALVGVVDGALALASFIGAAFAGRYSKRLAAGPTVCVAVAFAALVTVPLVFVRSYAAVTAVFALLGLPFPIVNAMVMGFIFSKTPEAMQGRLATAVSAPAMLLTMFCSAADGSLLAAIGYRPTVALFAATVFAGAAILVSYRPLRRLPAAGQWEREPLP